MRFRRPLFNRSLYFVGPFPTPIDYSTIFVECNSVGPLAASLQPAQATMSSFATITQSSMQPMFQQVPTHTPIPPGLYLQQHIDYERLASALLQQMATAQVNQMQPSVFVFVPAVQLPSFPTAQQTIPQQPSVASFAVPPSVVRNLAFFVPSLPTLPLFTSQLGPRRQP